MGEGVQIALIVCGTILLSLLILCVFAHKNRKEE